METFKENEKANNLSPRLTVGFWALMVAFVVVLGLFFIPELEDLLKGPFFLLPLFIFSLLGGVLIFLTLKEGGEGRIEEVPIADRGFGCRIYRCCNFTQWLLCFGYRNRGYCPPALLDGGLTCSILPSCYPGLSFGLFGWSGG